MSTVQNPTNPLNEPKKNYRQDNNIFPVGYDNGTTMIYGLLTPHFAMNAVEGDNIPLDSRHKLLTHTLKSPLMSKVTMNKDYYAVPMRAVLPRTFELIYANPVQGDDVPADANCIVSITKLTALVRQMFMSTPTNQIVSENIVTNLIKASLLGEAIFSYGSLLTRLGYNLAPAFAFTTPDGKVLSYDKWFELYFIPFLKKACPVITVGNRAYRLDPSYAPDDAPASHQDGITAPKVGLHRLLELLRDNPDFNVSHSRLHTSEVSFTVGELTVSASSGATPLLSTTETINIDRLIAYQLVCAHFYTNDHVDFTFTAKMYRAVMETLLGTALASDEEASAEGVKTGAEFFEYNGSYVQYDLFSQNRVEALLDAYEGKDPSASDTVTMYSFVSLNQNAYPFLMNLLGFQKSLRYGDYFTGARVAPLAVGDVNAKVMDNSVSAIDITKSILMQRFLNSVNRAGQKFADYIKNLSGTHVAPDPTDPKYLSHVTSAIGGMEIENTAEKQGNIVTILKSSDGNFSFSCEVSEPTVLIGITSFTAKRLYSKSIDRFAFHKNRFDVFNKFFQYEGDQSIYRKEKDASEFLNGEVNANKSFAYTGRHMEYKQRNSIATGGMVEFLPSYAFITDTDDSEIKDQLGRELSPEFIRATSTEFDRFYESLANYSLAGYYHFIVYVENECNASRPMDMNPSIL